MQMFERLKNLEDTIVKRVEKNNGSIFRKSKIENIQKFGLDWKCTNFILKAIQHRKSYGTREGTFLFQYLPEKKSKQKELERKPKQ